MEELTRRLSFVLATAVAACGGGLPVSDAAGRDAPPIDAPVLDAPGPDGVVPDAAISPCGWQALDPAAYGACGVALGFVYDGTSCMPVTGCDCGADCKRFFADEGTCASMVAAAGCCNLSKLHGHIYTMPPVPGDSLCGTYEVCGTNDSAEIVAEFLGLLPGAECETSVVMMTYCVGLALQCVYQLPGGSLSPDEYEAFCALSLRPHLFHVACVASE